MLLVITRIGRGPPIGVLIGLTAGAAEEVTMAGAVRLPGAEEVVFMAHAVVAMALGAELVADAVNSSVLKDISG